MCVLFVVIAAGCVLLLFVTRQLQSIFAGCGFEVMCDRWAEQNQPRHCVSKSFCTEIYVVWHKSNETEFLLTVNFILFTNQSYPFRNSSLGQLHSDGGVSSIVRSSAGRLLLEYLSARRLRSSGYYPKYLNGTLSSGF